MTHAALGGNHEAEEIMKGLLLIVAALAAGAALAGCGGEGETSATTATTTTETQTTTGAGTTETTTTPEEEKPAVVRIAVVGGTPEGGIVRRTVDRGERVVLVVSSDVADEVHLHGYDVSRDVAAGGTARIRFRATIPGRFEVELEERGVQIADLTVEP
jgi:ABC-type glycerol-3-phosphate transport system substrate-binding protein